MQYNKGKCYLRQRGERCKEAQTLRSGAEEDKFYLLGQIRKGLTKDKQGRFQEATLSRQGTQSPHGDSTFCDDRGLHLQTREERNWEGR